MARLETALTYSDPSALVALYVYKAPEGPDKAYGNPDTRRDATALVYYDPSHSVSKSWFLTSPKPGKYIIALDPVYVPDAGLTVAYRDIVIHNAFGEMTSDDQESSLAPHAEKTAKVSWTTLANPAGERTLIAEAGLLITGVGYSKVLKDEVTGGKKLEIQPIPIATKIIRIEPKSRSSGSGIPHRERRYVSVAAVSRHAPCASNMPHGRN